jgi:hypothetical protein
MLCDFITLAMVRKRVVSMFIFFCGRIFRLEVWSNHVKKTLVVTEFTNKVVDTYFSLLFI